MIAAQGALELDALTPCQCGDLALQELFARSCSFSAAIRDNIDQTIGAKM